jgi:hypothetical protein
MENRRMNETIWNNMTDNELISHIGWTAPPLVQSLADRLERAADRTTLQQVSGSLNNLLEYLPDRLDKLLDAVESIDTLDESRDDIEKQLMGVYRDIKDELKGLDALLNQLNEEVEE